MVALLLLSGFIFAIYIAARSYLGERSDYVRRPASGLSDHPEQTGIAGLSNISIPLAEDAALAGWYAPPRNSRAAVLLVHGVAADRVALLFEARVLAEAGFGVLVMDLPGQGRSGGKIEWGLSERRAIGMAASWLARRPEIDPQRIGAFGMSMGGYVLAQAAVSDHHIAAIVLASTPHEVVEFNWQASSRWGWLSQYPTYWALRASGTPFDMAPKDILGQISPRPLLIIQGHRDSLVPEWMAHQLYKAARDPKQLYIVESAGHSDFATTAASEYSRRLVQFFDQTLRSI